MLGAEEEFQALFDLDGDGDISEHEKAKAYKMFAMVDKDGDGQLTKEELKQIAQQQKSSRRGRCRGGVWDGSVRCCWLLLFFSFLRVAAPCTVQYHDSRFPREVLTPAQHSARFRSSTESAARLHTRVRPRARLPLDVWKPSVSMPTYLQLALLMAAATSARSDLNPSPRPPMSPTTRTRRSSTAAFRVPTSHKGSTSRHGCCSILFNAVGQMCFEGYYNLCTQDADLSVTIGNLAPVPIAVGGGTAAATLSNSPWIDLPDNLIPGTVCDNTQIRLRDAIVAARGLVACVDMHIPCLGSLTISLPCLDIGDDTDDCSANEKCGCLMHPECGWCPASNTCTRMQPLAPSITDPLAPIQAPHYSTTQAICSCTGSIVTMRTDPANSCVPRLPPFPPPHPPPSPPKPPGDPPIHPPFIDPMWLNGIALEANPDAIAPLLIQWLAWAGTLLLVFLCLLGCACTKSQPPLKAGDDLTGPISIDTGAAGNNNALHNEAQLARLPSQIQYAAAAAIEGSAELGQPPYILWLGQPRVLPLKPTRHLPMAPRHDRKRCAAHHGAEHFITKATTRRRRPSCCDHTTRPTARINAPFNHRVTPRARTVYVLTESGALSLNLAPTIPIPFDSEVRFTAYTQMLSEGTPMRGCCGTNDIVFASRASLARPSSNNPQGGKRGGSGGGGATVFRAVPEAEQAALCGLITRKVGAAASRACTRSAAGRLVGRH